jgi:hypothetical protein
VLRRDPRAGSDTAGQTHVASTMEVTAALEVFLHR